MDVDGWDGTTLRPSEPLAECSCSAQTFSILETRIFHISHPCTPSLPCPFPLQKNVHSFFNMQNENGENVDLYVPRKCSWTKRLLTAKDHGSVQINVANIDPVTGVYTKEDSTFALSGYVRFRSEGDMALSELVKKNDAQMLTAQE
mmetsp:Transcript_5969/g.8863  ORF Transcript_5969/g.8863 Transcript_5969/m.8863 type:complete len:146 (+) Transcript_5969:29-466(+)